MKRKKEKLIACKKEIMRLLLRKPPQLPAGSEVLAGCRKRRRKRPSVPLQMTKDETERKKEGFYLLVAKPSFRIDSLQHFRLSSGISYVVPFTSVVVVVVVVVFVVPGSHCQADSC